MPLLHLSAGLRLPRRRLEAPAASAGRRRPSPTVIPASRLGPCLARPAPQAGRPRSRGMKPAWHPPGALFPAETTSSGTIRPPSLAWRTYLPMTTPSIPATASEPLVPRHWTLRVGARAGMPGPQDGNRQPPGARDLSFSVRHCLAASPGGFSCQSHQGSTQTCQTGSQSMDEYASSASLRAAAFPPGQTASLCAGPDCMSNAGGMPVTGRCSSPFSRCVSLGARGGRHAE